MILYKQYYTHIQIYTMNINLNYALNIKLLKYGFEFFIDITILLL